MKYIILVAILTFASPDMFAQPTTGSVPPIVVVPHRNPQHPIETQDFSAEKLIPLIGQEIKSADLLCMVPQTPLIYDDFLNNYRVLSTLPLDTLAQCPVGPYETYYFSCLLRGELRTYLEAFVHLNKKSVKALRKKYPELSRKQAGEIVDYYRKILKHTDKK